MGWWRFQSQSPTEKAPAKKLTSLEARIDAELDEFLQRPEFYATIPARADWDVLSDSVIKIEQDDPPPRPTVADFRGTGVYSGPDRSGGVVTVRCGNDQLESAIVNGLQWLVDHQQPDGGWSFAHRLKSCPEDCLHPGSGGENRAAATALVILPFLGAGQTHKTGKWKKNVEAGLYFLCQQMRVQSEGNARFGIFAADSRMPSQSLAVLALTETYHSTRDKGLQLPAQVALNHLLREPAVLDDGFRWLAIRSGELVYLDTQAPQAHRGELLKLVLTTRSAHAPTLLARDRLLVAVAALDRLFELKRPADFPFEDAPPSRDAVQPANDPELQQAVRLISEWGPQGDLEYQYFATLTMLQMGGNAWQTWNEKVRESLIANQETTGHLQGSWQFNADQRIESGGRLYCTALATMILEVYFRHLPVYGNVN